MCAELAGEETPLTQPQFIEAERKGRDREDKPEYKVQASRRRSAFPTRSNAIEYYHNSSWLEHGGAPDKAVKHRLCLRDRRLHQKDRQVSEKREQDHLPGRCGLPRAGDELLLHADLLREPDEKGHHQPLHPGGDDGFLHASSWRYTLSKTRPRPTASPIRCSSTSAAASRRKRRALNIKKKLTRQPRPCQPCAEVCGLPHRATSTSVRSTSSRAIPRSARVKLSRDAEFQGIMPVRGKILNCLKADYDRIFKSEIITDLIKVLGCGVEVQTKHGKELHRLRRWTTCAGTRSSSAPTPTWTATRSARSFSPCSTGSRRRSSSEGYVYIAESPLYEITGKEKTWFAYSEREKTEILESIGKAKVIDQPLQGPRRERPGDDVADHHEPRDPAAHPRHAGGRGRNGARCSICCWATISPDERSTSPRSAAGISIWQTCREL